MTVDFGSAQAKSVDVLSGNYLLATAPSGGGTVPVTVATPAGSSATTTTSLVSYKSFPSPCTPLLGGNVSTSLAP
jgi:hypothetical protein